VISTCEICGATLDGPVAAIMHYERIGRDSDCDRRVARGFRVAPDVVVSLGRGKDRRRRRATVS
jgi:hypothetical protein